MVVTDGARGHQHPDVLSVGVAIALLHLPAVHLAAAGSIERGADSRQVVGVADAEDVGAVQLELPVAEHVGHGAIDLDELPAAAGGQVGERHARRGVIECDAEALLTGERSVGRDGLGADVPGPAGGAHARLRAAGSSTARPWPPSNGPGTRPGGFLTPQPLPAIQPASTLCEALRGGKGSGRRKLRDA